MSAWKTDEIEIGWMDCTRFSFLVVILYYPYGRWRLWENWAKGVLGLSVLFLTIIYESVISKLKIRSPPGNYP